MLDSNLDCFSRNKWYGFSYIVFNKWDYFYIVINEEIPRTDKKDSISLLIDFGTLWTDIFAGVPYFASRSGLDFNNRIPNYFNGTFFGIFGNVSRICPLVAQASTYIGVLFVPIFTCIFVWLGMKFNSKLLETENELEIYMWSLAVYYFSAYSMYNLNIVMGGVWNKILPIFLVIILNRIDLKKGVWRIL